MDLQSLPFFRPFSPALRQELIKRGKIKTFSREDLIFKAGDNETDFYMLVQGRIQISKISKGGQRRILRTVQPGDTFAMVSMFDHKPMFITAEVVGEQAQVFVVQRSDFFELLEKHPELSRFVIDGLVSRLRRYGEAYASMTVYYVDQRFISYLLEMVDREKSKQVRLPDTVKTIAQHLGTAREVLSREISRMVKKGWIKKDGQMVKVVNRKAMEKRLTEV